MASLNQQYTAELLTSRLDHYKNSEAVVVAIPRRGVPVGYDIANMLHLDFDVLPCRKIRHPSDQEQSIGSVCIDDSYVGESCRNIPQDYVYHQIALIQHALGAKNRFYGRTCDIDLNGRTVILTDDVVKTGDTALACIKSIRKSKPKEIILAVPVITATAITLVVDKVDNIIFVTEMGGRQMVEDLYREFPSVSDAQVRDVIARSRSKSMQAIH